LGIIRELERNQPVGGLHMISRRNRVGNLAADPRQLLGLFIWGHLNKVRSSRKLEREGGRNLEAMWLLENLRPDFKTIADFRKDNGTPIKQTVVQFRLWCLSEGLYGREMVAVDGSKFKAVNNSERNFTKKKLAAVIERESARVAEYLKAIEAAERTGRRDVVGRLGDNLQRYQAGRPCRTPWRANEPIEFYSSRTPAENPR
jgi:transposase